MNSQTEQTSYAGGQGAAFSFDHGPNRMSFSADLGRICQQVGEQVRTAVAEIDFEGIGEELRRAMVEVGKEVREAADNFSREQRKSNPGSVRVDIHHEPAAATASSPDQSALMRERTAVLQMVAQGKITPEQAERLLDALGG
ncbi:MAG: hypothetical protein H6649_10480 [Caldilineae bacterium]|nr:hypothetical protein [Anaerolineae bacterium]MCB0205253.1 hypothetical protein [Anaerolineae bacterium]MCB0254838.1 hypothetical protein [Anaerolineae bacterium]MCB9154467.1 hypothetical protein [Caldilineae bacterium]